MTRMKDLDKSRVQALERGDGAGYLAACSRSGMEPENPELLEIGLADKYLESVERPGILKYDALRRITSEKPEVVADIVLRKLDGRVPVSYRLISLRGLGCDVENPVGMSGEMALRHFEDDVRPVVAGILRAEAPYVFDKMRERGELDTRFYETSFS